MVYTLKNDILTASFCSFGAELVSVMRGDCEYMWQKDATFWDGCAPVLFPICGRFFDGRYTCEGKEYKMGTHGFARHSEFEVVSATDTSVTFRLCANEATKTEYPFDFELTLTYTLDGERITCKADIRNTGNKILPATYGAHPAFNVPLDVGEFEDYFIEFGEECSPDELLFSATCFNTGKKKAYPLKDGKILQLRHSLFDIDGVFFSGMARKATLRSESSERCVTLIFDDLPYLGLWHMPRTSAPYVCIEPWCGLPTYDGEIDDLATKNDMFRILPGKQKTVTYQIIFG